MKIHHQTTKRAVRAGIELVIDGDMVNAVHNGRTLARSEDPKAALETALRELNGGAAPKRARKAKAPKSRPSHEDDAGDEGEFDDDAEGDEDGEDEGEAEGDEKGEGKSVVKRKYRTKYRPYKHTCGDSLTQQIAKEFMTKADPDSKKPKFDWARFVRFAKENDCWVGAYAQLNHGLARMNVANRLRAKIRKEVEINWNVD
jgi:hypothetical protein